MKVELTEDLVKLIINVTANHMKMRQDNPYVKTLLEMLRATEVAIRMSIVRDVQAILTRNSPSPIGESEDFGTHLASDDDGA